VGADCLLTRHDDAGWSDPALLDGRRDEHEWAIPCGNPVHLGDGHWVVPAERHAVAADAEWLRRYHAFSLGSVDDARTWQVQGPMLNDPDQRCVYYDQHLATVGDRLLTVAWVHDVIADRTLPARAAWSDDHGATWTAPHETGIVGGPVSPVALPDGRLLAVYPRRDPPRGVRACVSEDQGRTWRLDEELVIWDDTVRRVVGVPAAQVDATPDADPLWHTMWGWTFGLPVPALLDDGSVGVAFYAADEGGASAVRFVRITV